MIDWMIDDNCIDVLDTEGVTMVKDMIMGAKAGHASAWDPSRNFLYEIVANGRNSIDTDKMDYLSRDAYYMGVKTSFDHKRLLSQQRVIGGEICYHAKEVYSILELFHTRHRLFKNCYNHRASKSLEYMVCDALVEADRVWDRRISNAVHRPEDYARLTDTLIREIEISQDPALEKARSIVHDLRKRHLYRFVDEWIVKPELLSIPKVTPEALFSTGGWDPTVKVTEHDIIVHDHKLNYANGSRNPLEVTRFFRPGDMDRSFQLDAAKVGYILPGNFEERVIRVYSRSRDQAVVKAIHVAFRKYLRSFSREVPQVPAVSSQVYRSPKQPPASSRSVGSGARRARDSPSVTGISPYASDVDSRPTKRGRAPLAIIPEISAGAAAAAAATAPAATGSAAARRLSNPWTKSKRL